MDERLHKFLAGAGVASRRACETLILEGRVTVNGRVVRRLGTKVDPARDAVKVDGRRIHAPRGARSWFALNKPRGYVTTRSDPEGRPTVADLARHLSRRIVPVGRLDFHSEGLLLLSDDGELAHRLLDPASEVPKTYRVKVRGEPSRESCRRIEEGIALDGRRTRPARVRILRRGKNTWLEIVITEGRKHVVRRLFDAIGHPVQRLRRTAFGPVALGDLPSGRIRRLTPEEVEALRSVRPRARRAPRKSRRSP